MSLVVYPDGGKLMSWNGKEVIGTCQVISSRSAIFFGHRSWVADRQYFYRATIDGKAYHGRGFGDGMALKLHACKG